MQGSNLVWKIVGDTPAANALLIRGWDAELADSEYVIYHLASGDTHLVGYFAKLVLQTVQDNNVDTAGLVEKLALIVDVEVDEELRIRTEQMLIELDRLKLIEKCPQ